MTEEARIFAVLKPCVSGPRSDAALQIIVAGEHVKFASTRALVAQILSRCHPGPVPQADDQARALNRFRELRKQARRKGLKNRSDYLDAITLKLADEFPMLDNFATVTAKKPSGRMIRRARELKFDESLVGLRAESDQS